MLSFRLNQRYVEGNPPFIAIDIDISDSAREGCVVSTLTITSEPKDWRGAVQVEIPAEAVTAAGPSFEGWDSQIATVLPSQHHADKSDILCIQTIR